MKIKSVIPMEEQVSYDELSPQLLTSASGLLRKYFQKNPFKWQIRFVLWWEDEVIAVAR